jgi:manganese/zinc/iron transport system permease protein
MTEFLAATQPDWVRLVTLQDYNARVVLTGTSLLGMACGLVGTFLLLRKRALLSDAVAHATLPGVVIAFMIMIGAGMTGRALPGLLAGAAVTGVLGMLSVVAIQRWSPLKDDAALGIVLSVFFGFGVSLLGVAMRLEGVNAAGLSSFIYGKAASMLMADALVIGIAAVLAAAACLLLYKELTLLCFDPALAASQGWPAGVLDVFLMGLTVAVTVIGLQAVGLILVVALLVIPPAAARFWTDNLRKMMAIAGVVGAISGAIGTIVSALYARLPAGALIVLTAASLFAFSMIFGKARGLLWRAMEHRTLSKRVARQHMLRAIYEVAETSRVGEGRLSGIEVPVAAVVAKRSWIEKVVLAEIGLLASDELVTLRGGIVSLTRSGEDEAARIVRNHRLWEIFLLTHADIAPAHMDRDADRIEHVLDESMIDELEAVLEAQTARLPVPESPHVLPSTGELAT